MFNMLKQPSDTEVTIDSQLFAIKEFELIGSADEFMRVIRALNSANDAHVKRKIPKGKQNGRPLRHPNRRKYRPR